MNTNDAATMVEVLLEKPYWVVDFLPGQVPQGSAGQFATVEAFFLKSPQLDRLHSLFGDIILKLNCYYDYRVYLNIEESIMNPAPDSLYAQIMQNEGTLNILLEMENVLMTIHSDETHMTVYNPNPDFLRRLQQLATANGLFVWKPEQGLL